MTKTSRARDPEGTRGRILDAAFIEFCAKGLAGARVDEIAARAGTNKRMLYHYFGSKEDLFRALLNEKSKRTVEDREEAPEGSLPDSLAHWQMHQLNDVDWTRLITWEALAYGADDIVNEAERAHGWKALIASIKQAQREGDLPSELDAAQLQLSLVALVTFPVAFPQFTKMITGMAPSDPAFAKKRQKFLRALAKLIEEAA